MDNKTKSDRIFELLPQALNAKSDTNWSSVVNAIGSEDQRLADLIKSVREQFFVKTASRPYLDRLAANSGIVRPRFVGMSDTTFRNYIPVLSYQPQQVKRIVDQLLDIFFLKEATTAFLSSIQYSPFVLQDGWDLQILVDNSNTETIVFKSADFTDITVATAEEVVAAYNRQAQFSFATVFFDSITAQNYIRIFTNTTGTQGSLQVLGGLACIGLQVNGFLSDLGGNSGTQWVVTKIGDTVTFTYNGGSSPGIDQLQEGDIFFCNLLGNIGSFPISSVNIQTSSFQFTNLLATTGTFSQTSSVQTKFLRPEKLTAYKSSRRALTWETGNGITVEIPATPTIQRNLKGSFHLNGNAPLITDFTNNTLTVDDASSFPTSGFFFIEPITSLVTRLTGNEGDEVVTYTTNGQLIHDATRYAYAGISGNTLQGISPDLPTSANLEEITINTLVRSNGVITCTANNSFSVGDPIVIRGSSGIEVLQTTANITTNSPILTSVANTAGLTPGQLVSGTGIPPDSEIVAVNGSSVTISKGATQTGTGLSVTFSENTNGGFILKTASPTDFSFDCLGLDGTANVAGTALREKFQLVANAARIIVTTAAPNTGIIGPYVWDPKAPFVLSMDTATSSTAVQGGKTAKSIAISDSTLPTSGGLVILDYGQTNQEGPIRYLYRSNNVLVLDPSYTFKYSHDAGFAITGINHNGPHEISNNGAEYAPYLTDPSSARETLESLISSVVSAGMFVDFLVRYPTQLYGTLSVYD